MLPISEFKIKACEELQEQYKYLKAKTILAIVNRYIKVVTNEVLSNLAQKQMLGNLAQIRFKTVMRSGGRRLLLKESTKKIYMQKWFDENLRLFDVLEKGIYLKAKNVSRLTIINLKYELLFLGKNKKDFVVEMFDINSALNFSGADKEVVFRFLYGVQYEVFKNYESDKNLADEVVVDLGGLKKYINKITKKYEREKLINDADAGINGKAEIQDAVRIYKAAKLNNGSLIQIINESDFGRKYYKAVNLQSTSKSTRHVALGSCIEFDLENAVYTWRYNEVLKIQRDSVWDATEDYLNRKQYWRETLANNVFGKTRSKALKEDNIKKIKKAFTAMSFGARGSAKGGFYLASDGSVTNLALNEIIGDTEKSACFIQHRFVKAFVREQNKISKIIFDAVKHTLVGCNFLHNKKGLVVNRALAYCYQQNERMIMNACIKHIKKDDFLLMVHDAFYVRKMDKKTLVKIEKTLASFNALLKLDKTVRKI